MLPLGWRSFFSGSSTPDHEFRWWKIAQSTKASAILVNNGPNEWYQRGIDGLGGNVEEVTATFRAWANHLRAEQIYTVGTSMGGAGAILYGAHLNAKVLAFAAEVRMDYPRGNVKRLMVKEFDPLFPDLKDVIEPSGAEITLISGESEPVDLLSAWHLKDVAQVTALSLSNVTHGPPNFLKARGMLEPVLEAFLADQPLPPLPVGKGLVCGDYPVRLYAAYCADKDKDFEAAKVHAEDALGLYPEGTLARYLLGRSLMNIGRHSDAAPHLKRAVQQHKSAINRYAYGNVLIKLQRFDEAIRTFQSMASSYPAEPDSHRGLAIAYWSAGLKDRAVASARRAADLAPANAKHAEFADRLARRLE